MADICLIGTGGMLPLKNRWLTSCYIEQDGKGILIDCGEGTQIALCEFGLKLSRIEMLLLTHCHADHVCGLPGLLLSIGNCCRTEPIDIYFPEGFRQLIKNLLSICGKLPYEVNLHELPINAKSAFTAKKIGELVTVSSLPLRHSVDCLGYSVEFGRKPLFLPDAAKSLGVPLALWKTLHSGQAVTLSDGREILPEQVTQNTRRAAKLCYVTDTLPFNEIADFARNSDLFICEGMYGDESKKDSMNKKGHMLMQDACKLAKKAAAARLWLTHYSPAEKNPKAYEKSISRIFPNVRICADGDKITLPFAKNESE